MRFDWGLTGVGEASERELAILAHTPGIPMEWIYAVTGLSAYKVRTMIDGVDRAEFLELGKVNAETVVEGDGWKMLQALPKDYAGAVPMWSQIELQHGARSDVAVGKALGINAQKARKWRIKAIFCPLTGVRIIPNRGVPIGHSLL